MNITLDASLFVSAFQENEKSHRLAKDILEKIFTDRISVVCHALFFFEVGASLYRKTQNRTALKYGLSIAQALPASQYVAIDEELFSSQAGYIPSWGLKGADAIYVAVASRHHARLVTFDQEILTRAEKWCVPAEKFLTTKI